MERDEFVRSLERLDRALKGVEEAIPGFREATKRVGDAVEAGRPVGESLQELHWPTIRRRLEESWTEFQQALYDSRCRSIRIMVDDEGMSLSEIARMRGLSRQLISRLYRDGSSARSSTDESPADTTE